MKLKIMSFIVIIGLFYSLQLALEQGDTIKERFLKRKPVLIALKNDGIIGENNRGFIVFRKPDEENINLVEEENADRLKVYSTIAKRHGIDVAEVGKRRAVQIARIAKPGHWLQDAKGKWYKKQ